MVELFMPFKSVAGLRVEPDGTRVALIDTAPVAVTAGGRTDYVSQVPLTLRQIENNLRAGSITPRERTVLTNARYSLMALRK